MTALIDAPEDDRLTTTEPPLGSNPAAKRRATHWRSAWRWHFYAAIFVLPVLLVLASTGLVILLKPTIERTFYGDRLYVTPAGKTVPFALQLDAVKASNPKASIDAVVPPRDPNRSTEVDITTAAHKSFSVYVNPYTAKVLGSIKNDRRIDKVASKIHGELFADKWGNWFVEMMAGWGLVMMLTGLYLWWPRTGRGGLRRAFVPRLRTPGRRRWRDLHAMTAEFAVVVFLVLTGLPWTKSWGHRWAHLADSLNANSHTPATPVSDLKAAQLQTAGLKVAWGSNLLSVPTSATSDGIQRAPGDTHHDPAVPGAPTTPHQLDLEQVAAVAGQTHMRPGYAIGLPASAKGVFTLSNSWPSPTGDERTVFVDQYSGKILNEGGWSRYGPLAKVTSWGIDTHMGRQYGTLDAVVVGGACLAIIGSVITAPVMYWKRRPRGKPGFPRRPPRRPPPPNCADHRRPHRAQLPAPRRQHGRRRSPRPPRHPAHRQAPDHVRDAGVIAVLDPDRRPPADRSPDMSETAPEATVPEATVPEATVPDCALAKICTFCRDATAEHRRNEVRIDADISDYVITIVDCRPAGRHRERAWSRVSVAQLRYQPQGMLWTLYWIDSEGCWRRYDRLQPTTDLDAVLAEMCTDPLSIFLDRT